jgi:sulfite reductase alpha subunit-like flavoprotein
MDDMQLAELAAVRDVLVITSTFGDGGPPDNGAGFWDRLHSADAPALGGVRYAVLGIGDRSYANFCGHAKAIDGRFAALGATRMLERTECEAYDDAPMDRWAERVTALLGAPVEPGATNGRVSTLARATTVAEPFTRAKPLLAPLSRNVVLTAPTSRKEVRQFGFDISEYDVSYAVGDSLGVYATNDPATVDAWLAATGLRGDTSVEVDGNEQSLRDALILSYDMPSDVQPAELRRRIMQGQGRCEDTDDAEGQARQVAGEPQRPRRPRQVQLHHRSHTWPRSLAPPTAVELLLAMRLKPRPRLAGGGGAAAQDLDHGGEEDADV